MMWGTSPRMKAVAKYQSRKLVSKLSPTAARRRKKRTTKLPAVHDDNNGHGYETLTKYQKEEVTREMPSPLQLNKKVSKSEHDLVPRTTSFTV